MIALVNLATRALGINDNKIVKNGSKADKILKNLSKSKKLKNIKSKILTYTNIRAIKESMILTPSARTSF